MNIRSLTIGAELPTDEAARAILISRLADFARIGRAALEAGGFTVQYVRLSTQPLNEWLVPGENLAQRAAEVGKACARAGIDYCSFGTLQAQAGTTPELQALWDTIPDMLIAADNCFASIQVGTRETAGINLEAVQASARIIKALSERTEDGFGNLRFAAAANCPPHVPFFPASYYMPDERNSGAPEFGIALEAADIAVQAFRGATHHEEARSNLLAMLTDQAERVAQICARLSADSAYAFTGLDISMAPYPEQERSIAHALELVSGAPLGGPGTLAAATFFTGALKEARSRLPTTGYSGLMLPALEDQTLADRAAEGLVTVETLLLLSAVCGLGLDTVPLPGEISERALGRIILDMAALAVRLDKPLTARLFPVPGKQAGEPAEWPHFPYFAKGKVMAAQEPTSDGLLGGKWLGI